MAFVVSSGLEIRADEATTVNYIRYGDVAISRVRHNKILFNDLLFVMLMTQRRLNRPPEDITLTFFLFPSSRMCRALKIIFQKCSFDFNNS